MKMKWGVVFYFLIGVVFCQMSPDIPGFVPSTRSFAAGSLIIPMDNTLQSLNGQPFNLKAYGAVVQLLNNAVPVYWVIKTNKLKDAIDFNATASRILPSSVASSSLSFKAGPFVIDSVYRSTAQTVLTAYANSVAVYNLTNAITIEYRHFMAQRPFIMVSDFGGNANIQTAYLAAAGFVLNRDYTVIANFVTFTNATCATALSEPHTGSVPAGFNATLRSYVASGGNALAECAGVETWSTNTNILFTNGLTVNNVNDAQKVNNPDIPYTQYESTATANIGGSVDDWQASTGSILQSYAYGELESTVTTGIYAATFGRYFTTAHPVIGSMIFYIGGHSYATTNNLGDMNLVRMYLNAMITPSYRNATCGFNLGTDVITTLTTTTPAVSTNQVGALSFQVKVVANTLYNTPNCVTNVTVTLPPNITFVGLTASPNSCTFNAGPNTITCLNIPINATASLSLNFTGTATQDGTLPVSISSTNCGNNEVELANNVASTSVFSTSMAMLVITKAYNAASSVPQLNGTVVFTVTLFNNYTQTFNNILVNDSLTSGTCAFTSFTPSNGMVSVSFNSITGTWTISSLGAGASITLTLTCTPTNTTTVTNRACIVSATQTIPGYLTHECATASAPAISCITVTKTGNDTSLTTTEIELFTISATNNCPCELYNVTMSDAIPSQFSYVASSFTGSYTSITPQAWNEPFQTLSSNLTYSTGNWPVGWVEFGQVDNFGSGDIRVLADTLILGNSLRLFRNTRGVIIGPLSMTKLCQNNTFSMTYRQPLTNNDGSLVAEISTTGNAGPWTNVFSVPATGIIDLFYSTSTQTYSLSASSSNIYFRLYASDSNNNDQWYVRNVFAGSFLTGTATPASPGSFTPLPTITNIPAGGTYNFTFRASRSVIAVPTPATNVITTTATQCGTYTFSPPSTTVTNTFSCGPSTNNFTATANFAAAIVNAANCICNNTQGETYVTAPYDCTPCNNDGICADTENPQGCPNDCPVGLPCNNNGRCDSNENFASCPSDCPCTCNNDGYCNLKENTPCSDCDGAPCIPNGRCDFNENFSNCPTDCLPCSTNCMCERFEREWCIPDCVAPGACDNDGLCDANENSVLCSPNSCDCEFGACNGNGSCEPNETDQCIDCRNTCCVSNNKCEVGENGHNCIADCSQTGTVNGMCSRGETQVTTDCGTCH